MCSLPWILLDFSTGPACVGRYFAWKRRKTLKPLQPRVPNTQSQLLLKPRWARMAPLLPPFLIMTGPRGPEQREGKAEWGLQVGKEDTGRERGWQLKQTCCTGKKRVCGQTQRVATPHLPCILRLVTTQEFSGYTCCRTSEMGKGETPLGLSFKSRLVRLRIIIKFWLSLCETRRHDRFCHYAKGAWVDRNM